MNGFLIVFILSILVYFGGCGLEGSFNPEDANPDSSASNAGILSSSTNTSAGSSSPYSLDYTSSSNMTVSSSLSYSMSSNEIQLQSGSFIDERDNKEYQWVQIGEQIWMAENLNYAEKPRSYCLENSEEKCDIYGRLYEWSTAMNIAEGYNVSEWDGVDDSHQGICPNGWRLPSGTDWWRLEEYVMSEAGLVGKGDLVVGYLLKSVEGWQVNTGVDAYGFKALPGGYSSVNGSTAYEGAYGFWWSTIEFNSAEAYLKKLSYDRNSFSYYSDDKDKGFSVRCIQVK